MVYAWYRVELALETPRIYRSSGVMPKYGSRATVVMDNASIHKPRLIKIEASRNWSGNLPNSDAEVTFAKQFQYLCQWVEKVSDG